MIHSNEHLKRLARQAQDAVRQPNNEYDRLATALFQEMVGAERERWLLEEQQG